MPLWQAERPQIFTTKLKRAEQPEWCPAILGGILSLNSRML
jgi:hypothetical protein